MAQLAYETVNLLRGIIKRRGHPQGVCHAQRLMERLGAVIARAERDSLLIEKGSSFQGVSSFE